MDELKPQAAAAPQRDSTTNPNPNAVNNFKRRSDGKEDGVLSPPLDDDESYPSSSAARSICGVSSGPAVNLPLPPPLRKSAQGVQASNGEAVSVSSPSYNSDILPQTSVQQNFQEGAEKIQVPCRYAPNLGRNSLVISFSDDDSGSDEDEPKKRKALESKGNGGRFVKNQRLPATSIVKSSSSWKNSNNVNKVIPKKSVLSHVPRPSVSKMHGPNPRILGPSSVDQKSQVRNFSLHNRIQTNQKCEDKQNVALNSSKLQDLRQQIAIRENELKRKSFQQNTAVPNGNNIGSRENNTVRKYRSISVEPQQTDMKGQEQKRLKVGSSYSILKSSKGHQEVPLEKNSLASKEQALPDSYILGKNKTDHAQKVVPVSLKDSRMVDGKDGDQVVVLSENTANRADDGSDVNINCSTPDANRVVDSCDILNQAKLQTDLASNAIPGNTASVIGASFWNSLGSGSVPEQCLQSLIEMEEALEKELEEAQEHRHRCEIEERNSLRAYRCSQRALLEANARCNNLYRQRELYASHYNSLLINNSKFSMSSRPYKNAGIWPGSLNSLSENACAKHTSRVYLQPEYDVFNQVGNNLNLRCANSAPCNMPGQHIDGENMGSEHYSEPDASTSEFLPRKCNDASGVCSPSSDPSTSADEDEGRCLVDHESEQPTIKDTSNEKNDKEQERDLTNMANNQNEFSGSQDSLQLEAILRSELFARLGARASLKNVASSDNLDFAVELEAEKHVRSEKIQMSSGYIACSDAGKDMQSKVGGDMMKDTNEQERILSEAPAYVQHKPNSERRSLNSRSSAESEEHLGSLESPFFEISERSKSKKIPSASFGEYSNLVDLINFSPPFILRTAFGHVNYMASGSALRSPSRNLDGGSRDTCSKQTGTDYFCWSNWIKKSAERDFSGKEIGSYSCGTAVDPHWPLCLFEIRGRCNNKKCPWQHINDNLNVIDKHHHHETSKCTDGHEGSSVYREIKYSKQDALAPFYLVGVDILRVDSQSTDSVLDRRNVEFWKKSFSVFLILSPLYQKNFPADESFMYGSDGRFEVPGGWSRQLFYLQNRNGSTNQFKQSPIESVQALEKALVILNQDLDKLEGVKEALHVLSEAIDADPTCVVLWIVYLLVYYSNKPFDMGDIFHHAVKYNQGSYELWLMYINSQGQLDKRLAAYDTALSALCHYSSASDWVNMHASACILDLFVQMIDCLCMSGNINKAIQKVHELNYSPTYHDKSQSLLLSDILACLTISDKCIFWICCLYLIIYKKLPDCIVQQVESEKEILEAEWPLVNLVDDEKCMALTLAEMAADSIRSCTDDELEPSVSNQSSTRSAELFALNHMKCMVVLKGLSYGRSLLGKYIDSYPNCIEFRLISARMYKSESREPSFAGFEEILGNWQKEVPGIQCIWNQYAEYALQMGMNGFAKELMVRWFDTVWKVKCHQDDYNDPDSLQDFTMIANCSTQVSNHNSIDLMFGFLNLTLHRLLQNDHSGARVAVKRAVKAACREHYKHCIKELASFLVVDETYSEEKFPVSGVLEIIKTSLDHPRSFSDPEPLSRKFINTIQRPKVRQLITSMLSPISADVSVANYILESLHGPTLLPEKFGRQGDLVDFVETIMGLLPSNYQLAISLCKLISRSHLATADNSPGLFYWARLLLVNSIFHAIPLPPECVWAEAAGILCGISGIDPISKRFYARALSVYPFSVKLWTSYYMGSKACGDATTILEAARHKGIELETSQGG